MAARVWPTARRVSTRSVRRTTSRSSATSLDHFHTLREGGRVLRKTQGRAERAWTAAEEADKKVAQQDRQGQALTGYATQAVLKWQRAEAAFHQWEKEEGILKQIRQNCSPLPLQES